MIKLCNFFTLFLFLSVLRVEAIIIKGPQPGLTKKHALKAKPHRKAHKAILHEDDNPYTQKKHRRHLNEYHYVTPVSKTISINHNLKLADFFIVLVAVFIGVLIILFLKPAFGSRLTVGKQARKLTLARKYRGHESRKLDDEDREGLLERISSRLHHGESKLATYINRVLFNKHNVYVSKSKLFKEVIKVRKYFDNSGLTVPEKLTERNLFQITRNVFWNVHHFNIDNRKTLAKKAIHTLYSHRANLFSTFVDAIKGI